MEDIIKLDNADADNLPVFEEQICPQDLKVEEDIHAKKEEQLGQDCVFIMIQYCDK